MSQDELANAVHVRRETISRLEQGKYIPSLKLAFDISKILNVSLDKLFEFE